LTQHEYNEHIRIVRYWNETDGHIDSVTGNHVTQQELRSTAAHNWYDKINILRIATTMDDKGNKIDFLERKEKKGNQWKQVVYIENLFDAIRDSHGLEHRGLGATKDEQKRNIITSQNTCVGTTSAHVHDAMDRDSKKRVMEHQNFHQNHKRRNRDRKVTIN
jgi:hypothetical protein